MVIEGYGPASATAWRRSGCVAALGARAVLDRECMCPWHVRAIFVEQFIGDDHLAIVTIDSRM